MHPRRPSPTARRKPWAPLRAAACLAVCALGLLCPTPAAPQRVDADKLVKVQAAFVLNFLRLTRWPEGGPEAASPLEVLVAGDPGVAAALTAAVRGREVHGRAVEVVGVSFPAAPPDGRSLPAVRQRLAAAEVLFLGDVPPAWRPRVADLLKEDPERARARLVVTRERWGVDERAAHLSFALSEGRVVFLLSMSAVEASPLRLSSKLMALAERVP